MDIDPAALIRNTLSATLQRFFRIPYGDADVPLSIQTAPKTVIGQRLSVAAVAVPAFGAATLCMLPILGALASPTHNTIYHLAGPASALFVPVLFNLALLAFVLALLLYFARPSNRFGVLVWSACFLGMPWVLLKSLTMLYELHFPHRVSLSVFVLCIVCTLLSAALWKPSRGPLYDRARRIGTQFLGLAAIFGAILVVQVVWFGWQARHLNDSVAAAQPRLASAQAHPLVLWIVFDEMSYAQALESRAPGLALPNIDRFAAQSNVFANVKPAGLYTDIVLPSIMTGLNVDAIRSSADGLNLYLHLPAASGAAGHWQTFDARKSVFGDAASLGYDPAVAGWYNPYCRLLGSVLDHCFWTGQTDFTAMYPARNIHANLFHLPLRLLKEIPGFLFAHRNAARNQAIDAQLHIDDYNQLYKAADTVLTQPSLDFVLLHLPIPHPDGIYDRAHGVLTTGPSTYLDNLALADHYLGHVRQVLEQQHEWDSATVIIMGDHSWRTELLWKTDPRWSAEEQAASHGGQFDPRPFYALKLPNQTTPQRIDQPYQAVHTKALIDELLRRDIATPEQLAHWVQTLH
jgi:hypothetical protein